MTLQTASVLAFERKLSVSDGQMYAGQWQDRMTSDNWSPITLHEKGVRGTISNRRKGSSPKDSAKLDGEIQDPNLQRVDVAMLPFACDSLKVTFTLKILGGVGLPSACNCPEYQDKLEKTVGDYIQSQTMFPLALRYAENIANARFLWRNRLGAEQIAVYVQHEEKTWVFDAHEFSLREFSGSGEALQELAKVIQMGLEGEGFTLLKVQAFALLGAGQEVFTSQELVLDSGGSSKGKKSKFLYEVAGVASVHSQKLGNAIRTIDTWYSDSVVAGPIAAEPFGAVTNRGKAYRPPAEKRDFYTLLDRWILKDQAPELEQQHFVVANLVRGGVFGESGK
ncbi:MAG: type I-F CRISPR-associated protein Csy3 [Chlamydiia bacterium]|nr:type I-F CRISPR-associated protein Csy3 [Chlamydiia bacterium]